MNVLVKILIVFDLLCFGVYFGGDILSTALAKVRKKPAKKELFEFYAEDADTPLSVDSIRQLYSGEVDTFVEEKLLPDAAQIVHHARKRFHAPAEAPVPAAALAVGKRRQQRQAAVVAAEIPALARAEVIHHALALAVHDDAHVAHPGVDHAREREIHHAVVPRERDRPVDAVLDQLAQLRLLFIGENNPVHAVHASTSP